VFAADSEFGIAYYLTENGRAPFIEWLDGLRDVKALRAVDLRIGRLKSGNFGDCKSFDSLIELRIDHGPGYRIYCAKDGKETILLLFGGTKCRQAQDIQKAKRYWADYQKRVAREHALRNLFLPRSP
jgi:putative addiction module killer protein